MAAVEDDRPTSSMSSLSEEDVKKLMSQGKRHLVCNEVVEAVKCFQEACRILGEKYGQTSNECGDAYFQYGKSLLELARVENGVLGNALKEVTVEESDSDEETKMNTVGPKIKDIPEEEKEAVKESVLSAMEAKTTEDTAAGVSAEKPEEEATSTDKHEVENSVAEESNNAEGTEEKQEENKEKDVVEKSPVDIKSVDETVAETNIDEKNVDEDRAKNKEDTSEEQKEVDECEDTGKDNDKSEVRPHDEEAGDEHKEESEDKEENTNDDDGEAKNGDNEDMDADEIPTLQLAWEMLELARIIFRRHSNNSSQLKLAQAYSLLGEIHMEQEQFSDAVRELTNCLNIQKNLLRPDDRLLAETYYHLGLAYNLSMKYEESACHYDNATEVLELRIKNIRARIESEEEKDKGKGKACDDDSLVKDRSELAELLSLLPEIKEKSVDSKNEGEKLKSNIKEKLGLTFTGFGTESSASSCSGESVKPASDITHLVRRQKRKPEDEQESAENSDAPAKKSRPDDEGIAMPNENGESAMASKATTAGE